MGNSNNSEKGKWEPCWFQANEEKIYYSNKPLHRNHPANTGEDTDTRIKPDDVIMSSRGKIEILNQDKTKEATYKRISSAAKKVIEGNPYVREERKKKEAANSKKKMPANEKPEKRKRQEVEEMDEKH